MQNGYLQKKYLHALYGIRISVVMPNSKNRRDPKKQKRYYNAPDEIKRIIYHIRSLQLPLSRSAQNKT